MQPVKYYPLKINKKLSYLVDSTKHDQFCLRARLLNLFRKQTINSIQFNLAGGLSYEQDLHIVMILQYIYR